MITGALLCGVAIGAMLAVGLRAAIDFGMRG